MVVEPNIEASRPRFGLIGLSEIWPKARIYTVEAAKHYVANYISCPTWWFPVYGLWTAHRTEETL